MTSSTLRLRTTLVVASLLPVAGMARADCAPVIAAYAKAESSGRYAVYDVATMDAPAKGQPFQVTVGRAGYIFMGEKYKSIGGGTAGSEGQALKAREQKGTARCEPIADHSFGGESAAGWRIHDARARSLGDDAAINFYVSKSTGLPIYHAMGSNAGLRWAYGPTVVVPGADRIEK